MFKNLFNKSKKFDSAISETYLYNYMNQFGVFLFWTLLFVLLIEIAVIIATSLGFFPVHLSITSESRDPSQKAFIQNIIMVNLLSWVVYSVYSVVYKFVSYEGKKVALSVAFMCITTIYTFGLYRFSYLSFFYVLPIIVSIPLGRKCRIGVFISSLVLSFIYSIYQQKLFNADLDYLVNSVTLITLVASYLLTTNVYRTFTKSLLDIEDYASQVELLSDNIIHDFVTGAFTKYALYKDLRHNTDYFSIAFLDLDDFKGVNDKMGHEKGDQILKLLVTSVKRSNEIVYRYGGDEFVVLSELTPDLLAAKIEHIKNYFTETAESDYKYNISFSAGVAPIDLDMSIAEVISQCDQMMYVSKHNGKNKVTLKD